MYDAKKNLINRKTAIYLSTYFKPLIEKKLFNQL